jgi:hypothetical protein
MQSGNRRRPIMRSHIAFTGAIVAGLSLGLGPLSARAGDDLALPPDLRAEKPPTNPKASKPSLAKKEAHPKAPLALEKSAAPVTKLEKPVPASKDDNALSVGMQWNASNAPNYGSTSTSGLVGEVNKNLNGAPVGSGAEVGFKYKF